MENDESKKNRFWNVIVILGFIAFIAFGIYFVMGEIKDKQEVTNDLQFSFDVCSKVSGTPSWASENGSIIGVGYIPFGNASLEIVNEYLIPNKVYFVYSTGCGYCAKQVQELGETWNDYVKSNLTINCVDVFNQVRENEKEE